MDSSTSVSLLQRLRQPNQEAAWQRFVDLYAPLIFHWGRNQGLTPPDAADLVQEVLSLLVVKLPEFEYDPTRRFRGWLRTITINKARDFHRRMSARPLTGQDETIEYVTVAPDVDLFDEAEYRSFLVNRALELMRAEFRDDTWQACWKQVVEGRKAADVAQEMGLSLNMVYLAKSRVLGRLREELAGLME
jgi:RNA polymerase sigma-70 factor (ECF subfamily)